MNDDNLITIIPPPGEGLKCWDGTRFILRDGTEVQGVIRCGLTIERNAVMVATLDIEIDQQQPIEAHPLLSLKTLREAAAHYGLRLVTQEWFDRVEGP